MDARICIHFYLHHLVRITSLQITTNDHEPYVDNYKSGKVYLASFIQFDLHMLICISKYLGCLRR